MVTWLVGPLWVSQPTLLAQTSTGWLSPKVKFAWLIMASIAWLLQLDGSLVHAGNGWTNKSTQLKWKCFSAQWQGICQLIGLIPTILYGFKIMPPVGGPKLCHQLVAAKYYMAFSLVKHPISAPLESLFRALTSSRGFSWDNSELVQGKGFFSHCQNVAVFSCA